MPLEKYQLKDSEYSISYHKEIETIRQQWESVAPVNIFFSIKYLHFIEQNPPKGMQCRYGIFYKDDEPVGLLLLQVKHIALGESLKIERDISINRYISKISSSIKTLLAKKVNFNTLLVGNMMLTGEYGFYFKDVSRSFYSNFKLVENSLPHISECLDQEGLKVGSVLMKDFYEYNAISKSIENLKSSFAEYKVQPDMVMQLQHDWSTFDAYLKSLKSKYRVRVKRAIKKAAMVERRELDIAEIKEHENIIYQQYLETAKVAGFNLFLLPKNYFSGLKEVLGSNFKLVAYFIEGKLLGYYTVIFNHKHADAHFLGYNKSENAQYQTYLNMLFDIIREAIDADSDCVHFSRTALEIKSSVGAVPEEMVFYLRSQKSLQNKFVPGMLKILVPQETWVPRTPFK